MSPGTIALIQGGTAVAAAITAFVNVVALFSRRAADPSAMVVIREQAKRSSRANNKTAAALKELNKIIREDLHGMDKTISHIKSTTDRFAGNRKGS